MALPDVISNEQELDEILTRPSQRLIEFFKTLSGDILVLGVAGKMGPSLAILAKRASAEASVTKRVVGAARFSQSHVREQLTAAGIETVACDLLDEQSVQGLPEVENVIYMVGMKFGTSGQEDATWVVNSYLPGRLTQKFKHSRIVLFSTGNVYPLTPVLDGGLREADATGPIGEYAQSALGRERVFQYFCRAQSTPGVIFRLNYAIALRYGVLLDIAQRVHSQQPIDLAMGHANVIWQGDANAIALRALEHAGNPPLVLNATGPEIVSIRRVAERFAESFGIAPKFEGTEAGTALLSNAGLCHRLFGYPEVTLDHMIAWTAHWVKIGGPTLAKPTHFEERSGRY